MLHADCDKHLCAADVQQLCSSWPGLSTFPAVRAAPAVCSTQPCALCLHHSTAHKAVAASICWAHLLLSSAIAGRLVSIVVALILGRQRLLAQRLVLCIPIIIRGRLLAPACTLSCEALVTPDH